MARKTYKLSLTLSEALFVTSLLANRIATDDEAKRIFKQMRKQYLKRIEKATKDINNEL